MVLVIDALETAPSPPPSPSVRATRTAGGVALAFYAVHAVEVVAGYPAVNLLWSCNVGAAMVGAGLLARAPTVLAAGTLLLAAGEPFWLADLATGGPFLPTAPLTHVGVLALGLWGTRRLGLPRRTWWVAGVVLALATAAARLAGPPVENVNLAHAIPRGFEWRWPSHGVYLAALGTAMAGVFALSQAALRAVGFAPDPDDRGGRG